jgi:lipoate-protein ligase A
MYMRKQAPGLIEGTASLAEFGVSADRDKLLQGLAAAFSVYFDVELKNDSLSKREQADRDELLTGRYNADSWNLEGVAN